MLKRRDDNQMHFVLFADICTLPVKVGACRGSLKKWYFDVESQRIESIETLKDLNDHIILSSLAKLAPFLYFFFYC